MQRRQNVGRQGVGTRGGFASASVAPPREETRCLPGDSAVAALDFQRIRRREGRDPDPPLVAEAIERKEPPPVPRQPILGLRPRRERVKYLLSGHGCRFGGDAATRDLGESPVALVGPVRFQLPAERILHQVRLLAGKLGDRDGPPRAEPEAWLASILIDADFAVSPEGMGPHVDGTHECPAPADQRSAWVDADFAILQNCDIGGGSPDIRDNRVPATGEVMRAGGAGCRPREDRMHGIGAGGGDVHQRAVTADHHRRRPNPRIAEHRAASVQQRLEPEDQACIQVGCKRPARPVQFRGQFMAAGGRKPGKTLDGVACLAFVGGISNREHAHDGERVDRTLQAIEPLGERCEVERSAFLAGGVMPASDQERPGRISEIGDAASPNGFLVKPDEYECGGACASLRECVGRERCRQRDHVDALRCYGGGSESALDRVADAHLEAVMGRARLGKAEHLAAAFPGAAVEHDGVGERAARVYSYVYPAA